MNYKKFIEEFKRSKMSRGELSRASGVNLSTISRLVSGEKLGVTGATVKRLEEGLRLKKGALL